MFLEGDAGSESVGRIVLEDAAGGVVDEDEAFMMADVGEGESADDVGSDGFNFVRFAPVHIGSTRDTRGVEHVAGLHSRYVRLQRRAVLQSAGAVLILDPALFAELTQ